MLNIGSISRGKPRIKIHLYSLFAASKTLRSKQMRSEKIKQTQNKNKKTTKKLLLQRKTHRS